MGQLKSVNQLAKFLDYVLGRNPFEFGLIPDTNGYVKIKELLKALSEEQGWKYVRRSHLNEIVISLPNPVVEISDDRIRATCRSHLKPAEPAQHLPKLLYTCVRRKSHPVVLDKGIFPLGSNPGVILSSDPGMANKIGKRIDCDPVMLTIQVALCQHSGVHFSQAGEGIFLAPHIPAGSFTGPPLPKLKPEAKIKEAPRAPVPEPFPGSFFPGFGTEEADKSSERRRRKQNDIARGKQRNHMRRRKQNSWPE